MTQYWFDNTKFWVMQYNNFANYFYILIIYLVFSMRYFGALISRTQVKYVRLKEAKWSIQGLVSFEHAEKKLSKKIVSLSLQIRWHQAFPFTMIKRCWNDQTTLPSCSNKLALI